MKTCSIKKTELNEKDPLSKAEQRRYEEIVRIQTYLSQGYSATVIKDMLHTTYFRVRRYAKGDPYKLCRFPSIKHHRVNYEHYREDIINYLQQNMQYKEIYARIKDDGYTGKHTQVKLYCHKLILELGIKHISKRNSVGVPIKEKQEINVHYVSSRDVFKYLWATQIERNDTQNLIINENDVKYIFDKYPILSELQQSIDDFRAIYAAKDAKLMDSYIDKYKTSLIDALKSFANGLSLDIDAVKNSVISEMSNGFVEGNNSKVKLIKRSMYGRAKLPLLRAKILLA